MKARSPRIIPRKLLFGNPERAAVTVSPDGTKLAFLAPAEGVLNVWVAPAAEPEKAEPVTHDCRRGIRSYHWAHTNAHVLYIQDKDGDENWHVYATDLRTKQTRDLTPFPATQAEIQETSRRFPEEILVGLNNRDAKYHDVHRLNILTGALRLVQKNTEFAGFVTDEQYAVRIAARQTLDGGMEFLKSAGADRWEPFVKAALEDALGTRPLAFDETGRTLYMTDSRDRDTAALFAWDWNSGRRVLLAEDPRADPGEVLRHPVSRVVQAVSFDYERVAWKVLDAEIAPDFEVLRAASEGDFRVVSRSLDDSTWIVAYALDIGPARFYRYDRKSRRAEFLFTNRPALEGQPLAKMRPVVIRSRDGLDMVSYLTLPGGAGDKPRKSLPMVLHVHGGPWGRDHWGFNPIHQWLANRGYAVLSVNFRGSTGFGKKFLNAGNLEWGRKMHDDLLDAVDWAIARRIADPARVALFGGSYGGYATLAGLAFTPEKFACGIDLVGPSSLVTLLNSVPPYWLPSIELFTKRVGDHRTEEGRRLLNERSPLTRADRIRRPLLIGQGANDPRVKQAESDQIVAAMRTRNIPVTYLLYTDEGHGFARPENWLSFTAASEAFLAGHLGGRVEAVGGDFQNSSITCRAGGEQVAGLAEALEKNNPQIGSVAKDGTDNGE
jgi:dipeptidyl aminopeptidase/acylaminoacyl peptidase